MTVRTVRIAELKDDLSAHLRAVRGGEEIIVCDRDRPIARNVPFEGAGDLDDHERRLVADGTLRPARARLDESFGALPAPRVAAARLRAAVLADRDDD